MASVLRLALGLGFVVGAAGCPDDTGNTDCQPGDEFCIQDAPQLGRDPGDQVLEISDSALAPGEPALKSVRLSNVGTGTLEVTDVRIEYEVPEGATDDYGTAFELMPLAVSLPAGIMPIDGEELPRGLNVQIRYTKQTDGLPRSATLVLESNDIVNPVQEVTVTTDVGVPRLLVEPEPIDFGLVPRNQEKKVTVTLLNSGSRVLNVNGFKILGDGRFGVRGDGFEITGPDAVLGVDLSEAIKVEAGSTATVETFFSSDSPAPADATLIVYSDDPSSGSSGYAVDMIANKSGPCILVTPRKVDFGGKLVGSIARIAVTLESCGTEALEVTGLELAPGSSPDFDLDYVMLGEGYEDGPSSGHPIVIPVNETVDIDVLFIPDAVNPRDADNVPIPDQGTILVASNAFESEVEVPISGAGSDVECPTPVIRVEEGEEVIPQTVLHLDASESYAPFGAVKDYLWQRPRPENGTAPAGTTSVLVPASTDPQPVFAVDIVGTYVFRLDVVDQNGNASGSEQCPTAEYTVIVQPDQAIHVELTWHTPGDVDEGDEGEGNGTDLDLHFAHQNAIGPDLDGDGFPDPWFDKTWDVFWYNTNPLNWGSFDPNAKDDPTLDRDDTDGAGPENLNLSVPEDGVTYTIGVHYWKDYGFGPSDATVKVFHYADLVYDVTYPEMEWLDMWCVGQIHWPAPVVERCAEEAEPEYVTPNYVNNFFRPPGS